MISKLWSSECILNFSWRTLIIWQMAQGRFLSHSFPHGHSVPACGNFIPGNIVYFPSLATIHLVPEYILGTTSPHVEIWWASEKGNNPSLHPTLHPQPSSGPECRLWTETLQTKHSALPPRLKKSQPYELQRPHQPSKGDFHNLHTKLTYQILKPQPVVFLVTFWPLQKMPGLDMWFPWQSDVIQIRHLTLFLPKKMDTGLSGVCVFNGNRYLS